MAEIKIPTAETAGNGFRVPVDLGLYEKEALMAAAWKFSGDFHVYQMRYPKNPEIVEVVFESKNGSPVSPEVPKAFCNELLDQQVRCDTNRKFGHIRDLIVEEAFRPVTQKSPS